MEKITVEWTLQPFKETLEEEKLFIVSFLQQAMRDMKQDFNMDTLADCRFIGSREEMRKRYSPTVLKFQFWSREAFDTFMTTEYYKELTSKKLRQKITTIFDDGEKIELSAF
jgi:hypothetical protein